jgi:hypothetical protein
MSCVLYDKEHSGTKRIYRTRKYWPKLNWFGFFFVNYPRYCLLLLYQKQTETMR